jgi:ferredoxin
MTQYRIQRDRCSGCGLCIKACPQQAILLENKQAHILAERCTACGTCEAVCRRGAALAIRAPLQPLSVKANRREVWQARRQQKYCRWRFNHQRFLNSLGLYSRGGQP